MAYRFSGTNNEVRFNPGAFVGYNGAMTWAILCKRNVTGAWHSLLATGTSANAVRWDTLEFTPADLLTTWPGGGASVVAPSALTSTSQFMALVVTCNFSGSTLPRFHWSINGGAWTHANATASLSSSGSPLVSTDRIIIGQEGSGSDDLAADVVCAGAVKSIMTDLAIESACSFTSYPTWVSSFTDWSVGFQASGTIADSSGNGGGEAARTGTTLVSDPAGWSWAGGPPPVSPNTYPLTAPRCITTKLELTKLQVTSLTNF